MPGALLQLAQNLEILSRNLVGREALLADASTGATETHSPATRDSLRKALLDNALGLEAL